MGSRVVLVALMLLAFTSVRALEGTSRTANAPETERTAAPKPILSEADAKAFSLELFEVFRKNDAALFLPLLPPELRKGFGAAQFAQSQAILRQNSGVPIRISFLTRLRNPNFMILLWKVEYERTDIEGRNQVTDGLMLTMFARDGEGFRLNTFRFF